MKTYSCENIQNLLPLYTEEKTSDEITVIIENHLRICQDCYEKYLTLKDVSQRIKSAFEKISKTDFISERIFFKNNISAYVDNELSPKDYFDFNQNTINNFEHQKELEEMLFFEEKLQQSLKENKKILNKDLSKEIINEIKRDTPDYLYKLYIKAASIAVFLLIITVLTGYFSVPGNVEKMANLNFSRILR